MMRRGTGRAPRLGGQAQPRGSHHLSDCVQLLQDSVFILLSEAPCQELIYLL